MLGYNPDDVIFYVHAGVATLDAALFELPSWGILDLPEEDNYLFKILTFTPKPIRSMKRY